MILSVFFNKNKLYINFIIHTKFWKKKTSPKITLGNLCHSELIWQNYMIIHCAEQKTNDVLKPHTILK